MSEEGIAGPRSRTQKERWEDMKDRGWKSTTVKFPPGDLRMLEEIKSMIGTGSTGEAVRTSVRVYYALLKQAKR